MLSFFAVYILVFVVGYFNGGDRDLVELGLVTLPLTSVAMLFISHA